MKTDDKNNSIPLFKGTQKNKRKKMQEAVKSFEKIQEILKNYPLKPKKPASSTIGKWETEQTVNIS